LLNKNSELTNALKFYTDRKYADAKCQTSTKMFADAEAQTDPIIFGHSHSDSSLRS